MTARRDLVDALAEVSMFARCSGRDLKAVARHADTIELPPGEELMAQGAPGDALFILLEGHAEVLVDDEVVADLGPGHHVGELALLDGAPRSATVRTTTPCVVAVLGRRMFRTLLAELPDLSGQLLAALAGELRRARQATDGQDAAPDRADDTTAERT